MCVCEYFTEVHQTLTEMTHKQDNREQIIAARCQQNNRKTFENEDKWVWSTGILVNAF